MTTRHGTTKTEPLVDPIDDLKQLGGKQIEGLPLVVFNGSGGPDLREPVIFYTYWSTPKQLEILTEILPELRARCRKLVVTVNIRAV